MLLTVWICDKKTPYFPSPWQTQSAGFGSKTKLSMQSSKAKKSVMSSRSFLRQYNAVGAVGYATVLADPDLPPNSFFVPGKRFRIRLRYEIIFNEQAYFCSSVTTSCLSCFWQYQLAVDTCVAFPSVASVTCVSSPLSNNSFAYPQWPSGYVIKFEFMSSNCYTFFC